MKGKRILAAVMAVTMAASLFSGCGSAKKSASNDELNIMIWDGSFSEQVFKDFEKKTGIKVNVSYIDNTDTIISKMVQGNANYDLLDIEAGYVKTFVKSGLLQKVDKKKITNMKYIDPEYNQGFIGDKNLQYTIPDQGPGYTVVLYNKETCPITIDSLDDLSNPALKGQIAMVNSTISLYGAALEALGYKASSTNKTEISAANDLLEKIKPNVKAFVGESAVSQLENGECSVALCWDYATICNDSKDNWNKFAVADIASPYEYFTQYWGVPKTSTHKKEAQELINFMLSPKEVAKSMKE